MNERQCKSVPKSLRRELHIDALVSANPCDGVRALGSYWPGRDNADLQSKLVKYFKESGPRLLSRPCMPAIIKTYAQLIAGMCRDLRPNAIVRVLSSGETRPDRERPQSLLTEHLSRLLQSPDFTHLFFRTEPRRPMRMIDRFAGPEVLRQRIHYVLQDLFMNPAHIGGTVLVVDDIYNLGATARVYAAALKQFADAERVYSTNIAAARFSGGKDGWGMLRLDTAQFAEIARTHAAPNDPPGAFDLLWEERNAPVFHTVSDCSRATGKVCPTLRLFLDESLVPCPTCSRSDVKNSVRSWLIGNL